MSDIQTTLTEQDFQNAAQTLQCEVAAIKAVTEVESSGYGFLPDGRPKILFEAHIFSAYTGHKFDQTYPDISSATWNKSLYSPTTEGEYVRLEKAMQLDTNAAYMASSWGLFQICGFNAKYCGYDDVAKYVADMKAGVNFQLNAFIKYCQSRGLDNALRTKDWAAFAYTYNGPLYAQNQYDVKLAWGYNKNKSAETGDLMIGSVGLKVIALQNALNIPADGQFGPATAQAVVHYQTDHGLQVSGVADHDTRTKLGLS